MKNLQNSDIVDKTEAYINELVYRLYGLTEKEINLVRGG